MFAVVVSVAAIIRFAAPVIDATQSSRPIAESIQAFSHEPVPVRSIKSVACRNTGLSFISIVRRKITKTEMSRPRRTSWLPPKVRNRKSRNSFPDAEYHI